MKSPPPVHLFLEMSDLVPFNQESAMFDPGISSRRRRKSLRVLRLEALETRDLLAVAILSAPASALGATAAFSVVNDWGSGFTGSLAITNTGASSINGWTLE